MSIDRDKIIEAQTIATDALTEVSAMLNQDDVTEKNLQHLQERLETLSELLNSVDEDQDS